MAETTATRLVLIRHGEAQAFLDSVVAGEKGCRGLSDLGRQQAEKLRERLARTGELAETDALYASILPRAIETAQIISPAVGAHEVEQDCDLCELHPGEADGMRWDDYMATYGGEDGSWDPRREMAPGGESWVIFVDRVTKGLQTLIERHPDQTVVVACHGGVVISSMISGLGLPPVEGDHFRNVPENTSLTEWRVDATGWKLIRYNDAAHLA
jgi:probable phosphoglycerate mutase